jgi:hypothetical protein
MSDTANKSRNQERIVAAPTETIRISFERYPGQNRPWDKSAGPIAKIIGDALRLTHPSISFKIRYRTVHTSYPSWVEVEINPLVATDVANTIGAALRTFTPEGRAAR